MILKSIQRGEKMSEEIKASKKVQHAIRMLDWHTDLAKRYHDTVKKWLDTNHIDYSTDLMKYIESKKKKVNENQMTIFDYM